MPRNHNLLLNDILDSIRKILDYAGNDSIDVLARNEMKIDAIVRNFEIIGEASKNLPESIKESHPDVEWRKIESFRNVLAHEYFGIDIDILWDIITNKLPDLSAGIRAIVKSEAQLSPHDRSSR